MKPHSVTRNGTVFASSVDSRPGYEASNYQVVYDHSDFVSNLYGVLSVPGRPYTYKNQDYTKSVTIDHNGTFGYLRVHPDGTESFTETGPIGPAPSLVPIGNSTIALNNAISKLAESVRGQIDLSIDGFQAKMTVKLARNILSLRREMEKAVLLTLAASTIRHIPRKRLPPKGTRAYYAYKEGLKLRRTVSANRRADYLLRRPIKDVGSAWLQFVYGVLPTLQTIHDLLGQEAVRVGNSLTVQTRTEKGYRQHVRGKTEYKAKGIDKSDPNRSFYTQRSSKYLTLIGGVYQPGTTYVESLSRFTSLNPASIAWELLPYSFVVDWFLDIGGYLRNMETALLSNMLGSFDGFITNLEIHHVTETSSGNGKSKANGYSYFGATKASGKLVVKRRRILSTFPLPRPPRFKAELSSGRMLNAAALLTTLLGRR